MNSESDTQSLPKEKVSVNKWIRKFRERTRMSGRGFAELLGIDCGNYSRYENGKLAVGDNFIERFAGACKLNEVEIELLRALASRDRILRVVKREDEL